MSFGMDAFEETGMSILEAPQAVALLEDATLSAAAVRGCESPRTRSNCRDHFLRFGGWKRLERALGHVLLVKMTEHRC
jgi:hypothetical protein